MGAHRFADDSQTIRRAMPLFARRDEQIVAERAETCRSLVSADSRPFVEWPMILERAAVRTTRVSSRRTDT